VLVGARSPYAELLVKPLQEPVCSQLNLPVTLPSSMGRRA
jgi:hypothetical protein